MDRVSLSQRHLLSLRNVKQAWWLCPQSPGMGLLLFNQQSNPVPVQGSRGFSPVPDPALALRDRHSLALRDRHSVSGWAPRARLPEFYLQECKSVNTSCWLMALACVPVPAGLQGLGKAACRRPLATECQPWARRVPVYPGGKDRE